MQFYVLYGGHCKSFSATYSKYSGKGKADLSNSTQKFPLTKQAWVCADHLLFFLLLP